MNQLQKDELGLKWYLFIDDQLLLKRTADARVMIPRSIEPPLPYESIQEVFTNEGEKIMAAQCSHSWTPDETWQPVQLRASFFELPLLDYLEAGKCFQVLYWDSHSRFCPVCGTPTNQKMPIMKKCPACGYEIYPTISTAIIVLIQKGDEILLVHSRNFKGNYFGLVAGFLEPGETLEECVRREVYEETGLEIKNIRYFQSQPWPYPSGIMVGFTAEYESGTIKLQDDELSAGAFYNANNLPPIPQKMSLARKLIDWWLNRPA